MVLCHVSLGPTSFNLKIWVNILISDEHQNVVAFMMIFIWVHHVLHLGSSYMNEHMKFWACHVFFTWISGQYSKYELFIKLQKVHFPDLPWDLVQDWVSGFCIFMPMLWEIVLSLYSTNSHACLSLIDQDRFALLLLFAFHLLYCS